MIATINVGLLGQEGLLLSRGQENKKQNQNKTERGVCCTHDAMTRYWRINEIREAPQLQGGQLPPAVQTSSVLITLFICKPSVPKHGHLEPNSPISGLPSVYPIHI